MRELTVSMFVTLDGVMQAPGGPDEDREGGFAFGGWTAPFWDDDGDRFMDETMTPPYDLMLGRKTYDIFSSYWPHHADAPGAKPLNDATKYVASRGRPPLDWGPAVLLDADVAEAVAKLRDDDGPALLSYGSGDLLQTLIRASLVDRYRLMIFPVVIGSGKRLFGDGAIPAGLRLVDGRVSSTGVFLGMYEPAGEVRTGTVGE
jgi:dihydrofolate reductase